MKTRSFLAFAMLFLASGIRAQVVGETNITTSTCNQELIRSYRLYPSNEPEIKDPFYICPYLKNSCCSFDSQKMIQVLWIRISQPRLQRILTHNLSSVEYIFETIKGILGIFTKNKLPLNKKYSAECLQSIDDMEDLIKAELADKLTEMFEKIKVAYNNLYKFKRQFYCDICNTENHPFFNIINKRVDFSINFCQKFAQDYINIASFFSFDLIKYFTTVKNYVQCYSNKNFLFLESLDEFKISGEDKNVIDDCRDNLVCAPFCQRYSLTDLPDILIGKKEYFDRMVFFLKHHKPDNRGYFISEPDYVKKYNEMMLQEHLENLRDSGKAVDAEEEDKLNAKIYVEQQNIKRDFEPGDSEEIEKAQLEIYKNSFEFFRTKFVKSKMIQIRKRVSEEYQDSMTFENFLTSMNANINLVQYKMRLTQDGIDPYTNLDKEKMYITNANLTLFSKEISNTVGELLYLNETTILKEMVDTGKLMQENPEVKEAVSVFIKNKIFDKESESSTYIIENPYIDTKLNASRRTIWLLLLLCICLL